KEYEAWFLNSVSKFRTLYETSPTGVVYLDAQGRITDANPAAQRILGLSLRQMQGRSSIDPRWRALR
ncbi:MAG: PAS domain-containing protein, partial [Planctomycetes bacterium]|nr:PAS domain-containing protein [Planctomycetota bacterium]